MIVAYLGGNATAADRDRFAARADRIVDPTDAMADRAVDGTASPSAEAAIELRERLGRIDGRLAVVAHDNPDPDAIASAVALVGVAESVGVTADACCYFGDISHQENRAMVNLLELDLRNMVPDDSLSEYSAFALVDHSRPGVNDQLPTDLNVDIVIDHHPPRGPVPGEFVDLREGAGATSTVLTEYVDRFDIAFDPSTATALLYGIRVDTNDFTREVSPADFRAASTLSPHVDTSILRQIEQPSLEGETLETIARAIKNRIQRDSVAVASVGRIGDRDALPQAADQLLAMEGVETTLVFGFDDEMVFLSARSRANDVDLGETLRDGFNRIGSAAAIRGHGRRPTRDRDSGQRRPRSGGRIDRQRGRGGDHEPVLRGDPDATWGPGWRLHADKRVAVHPARRAGRRRVGVSGVEGRVEIRLAASVPVLLRAALVSPCMDVVSDRTKPKVKEYMTRDVATVSPDETVSEVATRDRRERGAQRLSGLRASSRRGLHQLATCCSPGTTT